MARSKIKGTNGKPVAKTKKKNSNRASLTVTEESYHPVFRKNNVTIEGKNDGDPTVYVKTPGQKKKAAVRNRPEVANPIKDKPKYKGDKKVISKSSTRSGKNAASNRKFVDGLKENSKKYK